MVFYFTGTGNSKFVADRIARGLGEESINISKYILGEEKPVFKEEGTYVFVAPCYVSAPAKAMLDFIEEAEFPKGIKAYFIITCASYAGISPKVDKKISLKKDFEYMGTVQVVMPQNYIIFFKMGEKEGNKSIVNAAIPEIEKIATDIKNEVILTDKKTFILEYPATVAVAVLYYKFLMGTKKFYATDECIACQKCVRTCPLGNITMKDGKPVWGKNCTHCMGCINFCPKEAIEYGKGSVGKKRYAGPKSVL